MWTIGPEAVWPFDTCDCGLDPEKNDHSKGPAARTTARVGMLNGRGLNRAAEFDRPCVAASPAAASFYSCVSDGRTMMRS
jgi:hypothetical protein